jgi:hydroxyquinol 1,2-dioxygenase
VDFSEQTATNAVVASFASTPDTRLRELLGGIVTHLHDLVRETRPTVEEWKAAIEFLTATGQMCDDVRQEFVLLSDVLGVSMLVETINGQELGTESTVEGPFHLTTSPSRRNGDSIDLMGGAVPCAVSGRVTAPDGVPIAGAVVDVWQCTEEGFYDVQQPEVQPAGNGRGLFHTDDTGRYWFRTVVPSHYPIPVDGPVGRLLGASGRHPYRPAHIHFMVSAPGHAELTTHIFVADSPYLDSDAVFAVKSSLVAPFQPVNDEASAAAQGVRNPYVAAEIDLVLEPTAEAPERRVDVAGQQAVGTR